MSEAIVVEDTLPHAPDLVWRAITTPALMARWIRMIPTGFAPEVGTRFTFQTTPAGAWDGTIRCEVLEAIPPTRLVYAWRGGDAANTGYGSLLDTRVTFALRATEAGTHLTITHSGFELPRNQSAFANMGGGWKDVIARIVATVDTPDQD